MKGGGWCVRHLEVRVRVGVCIGVGSGMRLEDYLEVDWLSGQARQTSSKRLWSRAYLPNPLIVQSTLHSTPTTSPTTAITAVLAPPRCTYQGCACQLSDRKRPRPASPESAIYLYFVPCQAFMLLGSEIRLLCGAGATPPVAACFAQNTPRGAN